MCDITARICLRACLDSQHVHGITVFPQGSN